jgi:hypothetical protein
MIHIWSARRRIVDDVIVGFGCRRKERGIWFDVQSRSCSSIGCLASTGDERQHVVVATLGRPGNQADGARDRKWIHGSAEIRVIEF